MSGGLSSNFDLVICSTSSLTLDSLSVAPLSSNLTLAFHDVKPA